MVINIIIQCYHQFMFFIFILRCYLEFNNKCKGRITGNNNLTLILSTSFKLMLFEPQC